IEAADDFDESLVEELWAGGRGRAVTEDGWLQTTDLYTRLRFVARRSRDRRLRLFACACARGFLPATAEPYPEPLGVAEPGADGWVGEEGRAAAYAAARPGLWPDLAARTAQAALLWGAYQAAMRVPLLGFWSLQGGGTAARAAAEAVLLRLTDCLFGNPFRPP